MNEFNSIKVHFITYQCTDRPQTTKFTEQFVRRLYRLITLQLSSETSVNKYLQGVNSKVCSRYLQAPK